MKSTYLEVIRCALRLVLVVAMQAKSWSIIRVALIGLILPLAVSTALASGESVAEDRAAAIIEKNVFRPARVRQYFRFFRPVGPVATSQPARPTIRRSFRLTGLAPDGKGGWRGLLELENPSERRWIGLNDMLESVTVTAVDQKWLTLAAGDQTFRLEVGDDSSRLSAEPVTIEGPFVLRGLYVSGARKRAMVTMGEQSDESSRHVEIKPGDRLAGGVVKDITDQELLLERDGTTYKLRVGASGGGGGGGRHRIDGN